LLLEGKKTNRTGKKKGFIKKVRRKRKAKNPRRKSEQTNQTHNWGPQRKRTIGESAEGREEGGERQFPGVKESLLH